MKIENMLQRFSSIFFFKPPWFAQPATTATVFLGDISKDF